MEHLDIFQLLKDTFGEEKVKEHIVTGDEKKGYRDPYILVEGNALPEICRFLRGDERMQFNMLHCISGVDRPNYFECVYHIFSMHHRHWVILKVHTSKTEPHVPSISDIWPAANWLERETFDMYGIVFDHHPNLKRILLPEDWEGHPLQKEYQMPEHEHLREIGF